MAEAMKLGDTLGAFFVKQELIDEIPGRWIDRGAPEQAITEVSLLTRGGACPICGRNFMPTLVRNQFGEFRYYSPICHCFKKCDSALVETRPNFFERRRGCGRTMIVEKLLSFDRCVNCGGIIG